MHVLQVLEMYIRICEYVSFSLRERYLVRVQQWITTRPKNGYKSKALDFGIKLDRNPNSKIVWSLS
jgi:hypothetical protein